MEAESCREQSCIHFVSLPAKEGGKGRGGQSPIDPVEVCWNLALHTGNKEELGGDSPSPKLTDVLNISENYFP